jgi:hypothetical protein
MPRGDGTGPRGEGPGTGRGQGRGAGGRGRGGGFAAGPGGNCICPGCGHATPHRIGVPCNQQKCPQCGQPMTRQL